MVVDHTLVTEQQNRLSLCEIINYLTQNPQINILVNLWNFDILTCLIELILECKVNSMQYAHSRSILSRSMCFNLAF